MQPKPGRPRDPHLDTAVLDAALEVFGRRGFHRASVIEIARKAGVSTPAIYRRWPNKAAIAIDLVVRESVPDPIPDTGSIRRDLTKFFKARLKLWSSPVYRRVLVPVAAEAFLDRKLAKEVRRRTREYRNPGPVARIRKAVAKGELRADTVPERLLDMLQGPILIPLLLAQDPPEESDARRIVDDVLHGMAARHA